MNARRFVVNHAKNQRATPSSRPSCVSKRRLDSADVLRLPALGALHDVELHGLAFLQRAEAVALDGAEMHENVIARAAAQKAETLGIVEPLNCSLFHLDIVPCIYVPLNAICTLFASRAYS